MIEKKRIAAIFKLFEARSPLPKTELIYKSPFELLISVMLSAQATDKSVNLATPALFAIADTPKKMLALGEEKLKEKIKTIGLYPTKAKHIIKTAAILCDQFDSQLPRDMEGFLILPGVGRKTANVLLSVLYGEKTIAVDTHVFRVSKRLGLSEGQTVNQVEADLYQVIPKQYLEHAHHWLVLHGRYICQARKPLCSECLLTGLCPIFKLGL